MAIKKLKLTKSLAARTVAILVLIGMGGFAVWQSRSKQEDLTEGETEQTLVAAIDSTEESGASPSAEQASGLQDSRPSVEREKNFEVRTPPPLPAPSTFGTSSTSNQTPTDSETASTGSIPSIPAIAKTRPQGNLGQLLQKEEQDESGDENDTNSEVAAAGAAVSGFGGFKPPSSSFQNDTQPPVTSNGFATDENPARPPALPNSSGGAFSGGTLGQPSSISTTPPISAVIPKTDQEEPRAAAPGLLVGAGAAVDGGSGPPPSAGGFSSSGGASTGSTETKPTGESSLEDNGSIEEPQDSKAGTNSDEGTGAIPLPGGLGRPPVGLGTAVGVGTVAGIAADTADSLSQDRSSSDENSTQDLVSVPKTLPQRPSSGNFPGTTSGGTSSAFGGSNVSQTLAPQENNSDPLRSGALPPASIASDANQGPPATLGVPAGSAQNGGSTAAGPFNSTNSTGTSPRPSTSPPTAGIGQPLGSNTGVPRPSGSPSGNLASRSQTLNNRPETGGYSSNLGPSPATEHLRLQDHSLGLPGEAALEGIQTPALVIEKRAPAEIQRGKTTLLQFVVKNVGGSTATDVRVFDRIPQGAKLISAKPEPNHEGDQLIWKLGEVKPGEEVVLETTIVPEKTGELGSVAQVTFTSKATTRTLVTEPKLTITQTTPPVVMINDEINVQIRIENAGTGAAEEVTIETDIGEQVAHPAGSELRYEVGRLEPGDHQDLTLTLSAKQAGKIQQRLVVQGLGTSVVEDVAEFEIIAPKLDMTTTGPSLRYLDRKAIHKIDLDNRGTADATNVALVAALSPGLKFISADRNGTYDARTHAVYWSLESMPKGKGDTVRLTTVPTQIGEASIDYRLQADLIAETVDRQKMEVRELAELFFEIDDEVDPIEIGSETIYRVTVTNQGSKEATNVKMRMIFPPGIQVTEDVQSPVDYQQQADTLVFKTLDRIAPDQKIQIIVRAEGKRAGDQRVAFELSSDERPDWVRKEESTRVYSDR
jgi:uncharacterized repeat protein (TIGR01451 family)